MVAFLDLLAAGSWLVPPALEPVVFVAFVVALSTVLVLVCPRKGEPMRWRSCQD